MKDMALVVSLLGMGALLDGVEGFITMGVFCCFYGFLKIAERG